MGLESSLGAAGAAGISPTDFSVWALFLRADIVVKAVMVGLVLASIWSWTIIIHKWLQFRDLGRRADKFEEVFFAGESFDALYDRISHRPSHPMATVFVSGMREWRRSMSVVDGGPLLGGVRDRVERVMGYSIARELARAEGQLGFLATVGSTAPFVGLFGTVWGIMSAFQAIAVSKNTNLAIVAPGIAEALFATALGLLAAIPAVVAYNRFSGILGRYATRLEGFADEFSAVISRQIDKGFGEEPGDKLTRRGG